MQKIMERFFKPQLVQLCRKYERASDTAAAQLKRVNKALTDHKNDTVFGEAIIVDVKPQGKTKLDPGMKSRDSYGIGESRSGQVRLRESSL